MLKADDLMPKQEVEWPTEDFGCRRRPRVVDRSIKEEDMDMDISKQDMDIALDMDDIPPPPDDLYSKYKTTPYCCVLSSYKAWNFC